MRLDFWIGMLFAIGAIIVNVFFWRKIWLDHKLKKSICKDNSRNIILHRSLKPNRSDSYFLISSVEEDRFVASGATTIFEEKHLVSYV